MTISSPTFTRLQSGVTSADDLRVKEPINAMMKWLSGELLTQLNTHFGAVSTSISAALVALPAFRVHKNAVDQISISATFTPITFGTEALDRGGYFASNTWTPPARVVRMTAQVLFTGASGVDNEQLIVSILKDGAELATHFNTRAGTAGTAVMVSTVDQANGSNAYTVSASKSGAGTGTASGAAHHTFFCGEAVS
jgi:hypothetical protein